ncbi:MAG TPA: VWA domain-containing protein [Vicinamibacterales bacterium]|nr:VWA domain-containing protein [Vicinamibacterales bacterium]
MTIDAIVADARGRPLETLKAADFELREDGAVHAVDEARFVRDRARLFAIYLDEYHVSAGAASDRVRRALTAFLDSSVGPGDRVVVLKPLDSLLKIEFVEDRTAARAAIASFEGRRGDYVPRTDYERELMAGTPARLEAARAQIVWSGLDALSVHLGTFAGQRKTLIMASEPFLAPPHRRGQESLATLESAIRAATRSNVSVYALDPAEDPPAGGDALQPLERLAAETNGRVIDRDLDAGLRRLDADARGYYLLTYRSAHPDDGRFHAVQVRVKRAGEVRARGGFYDAAPDEALGAEILARLNAPKPKTPPEPAPHASPLIRPWFGWSRGADGRTRVTFVWEPAPAVPGERVRHSPTHLVLTALATDGTVLFEGAVAPTGAGTIDEPGATPSRATFETRPGRIKLRMAIQDAAAQPLDRDVRDVLVRDLSGAVALGTPEIMRARNALELRTLEAQAAVPVVSREFSRAEQLLLRVPVYGAVDAPPAVSARLLGRSGQTMRQLEAVAPSGPGAPDGFTLSLAGLATGEYTIEVTAKAATGTATDRLTFRVTS